MANQKFNQSFAYNGKQFEGNAVSKALKMRGRIPEKFTVYKKLMDLLYDVQQTIFIKNYMVYPEDGPNYQSTIKK